jgi:8-oxo-dGTP pyrophosphatase MutT (NUDIX family)
VVVAGDRVLVLYRPARHQVRLPKGHVEAGETPEKAALREVSEETGFEQLVVTRDLGEQVVRFDHGGRHWARTERYFLMTLHEGSTVPTGLGEAQFEPRWLSWPDALNALTFDAEREWLRRARRALDLEPG